MIRAATAISLAALVAATPAAAQNGKRTQITPYIEAGQVLSADLSSGDVLTYSTLAAGIDASSHSRRVEVELSYRYEHRFSWEKRQPDDDVHSGIARVQANLLPGLSLQAGGIATRARSDIRGATQANFIGDTANVSQVFSGYVGPSLATHSGPFTINAGYQFGYTKVDSPYGGTLLTAGQPSLDAYDDSRIQTAMASVGTRAGTILPIGLTVSGAWNREDAGQLDQRFDGKYGRADAVLPVTGSVALTGGVGYEKIRISQRDPVLDAAGRPVADSKGRFVTDKGSPRRTAYLTDGVIWDAGLIYRPNPRVVMEGRVGRRYGSMSYTGSLSAQTGRGMAVQVGVYDSVTTFGRQLNGNIAMLPTSFTPTVDPFSDNYTGCQFGSTGGSAGTCLGSAFQSISTAAYRARGIDGVLTIGQGRTRAGLGLGYVNRRYIAPDVPGALFSIDGVTDESFYGQFFIAHQLSPRAGVQATVIANYLQSGIADADSVFSGGVTGTFYYTIGHLSLNASAGLYGVGYDGQDDISLQGALGARYNF
jgi:hypothetical protein